MFVLIHGENITAAYNRLNILRKNQKEKPQVLSRENTYDDLTLSLLSTSILADQNFLVVYNFFKDKKIKSTDSMLNENTDKTVIFYEEAKLTPATLAKLPKHITIEYFKNEAKIFYFLDDISFNLNFTLQKLETLSASDESSLIWNLTNRFLLITLAQKGYSSQEASIATGRQLAPWQWQRLQGQAR
ncbi:hypothetical protein HY045_03415, partial [Candidatus Woesebacteria bacterium]|nr:hypothetical protein [Candidatus Woesebacteria bacterium]